MTKTILLIMVLVAAPAFADQSSPAPNRSARFGSQRPHSDPYKTLFEPRTTFGQRAPEHNVSEAKPQVVCGMRLIPGDASIDPKMAIPRPSNGIDYKLRTIDPPICSTPK
jgi:hypothetical protein